MRAAKKDVNHNEIAATLKAVGAEVFDLSPLPKMLDMLVAYRGMLFWFEVKPPEKRDKLTEHEIKTIERARLVGAPVYVICSADEALTIMDMVTR